MRCERFIKWQMFLVKCSFGKERRIYEDAVKMDLGETHVDDQRCLLVVSGNIRGFITTGFKTSVSVIAVLIMLYKCT